MAAKKGNKSERYKPIPYASEQGIFCGLAGNLNRRSGKLPPSSGNPLSSAIWAAQSDPPRDLEGCREGQRGAPPDCSRSRGPRHAELARERAPPRSPFGASRKGGVGPLRGAESRLRE